MNTIIAIVISLTFARNKPLIGAVLASSVICGLYLYQNIFSWMDFLNQTWIGISLSFAISFIGHFILSGTRGGKHNEGPSYMAGAGGGRGGAPPGGIIQSDEEIQRNKRK